MTDPILTVDNVSKVYEIYKRPLDRLSRFFGLGTKPEQFCALHGISMSLPRGAAIGVLGPNGAGKSTLLQLICGTVTPTTGGVHVGGRSAALLELGAGFDPELSGRENVRLYGSVLGLTAAQIDERFEEIVDFSEIRRFIDRPVKTYSSGMFVRLAFSVAIHVDPELLIIDEALSVGDGRFAQRSASKIRQLRERGVSLLFVSHDIEAVRRLCDEAIVLHHGRVVQRGDANHVANWYLAFVNAGFDLDALAESERRAAEHETAAPPSPATPTAETTPATEPAQTQAQTQALPSIQAHTETPPIHQGPPAVPPPASPLPGFDPDAQPEPDAPEFTRYRSGDGSARVTAVYVLNDDGTPNHHPAVTQSVTMVIECVFHEDTPSHVVGFYVRDRLGNDVIGLNTDMEGIPSTPKSSGDRVRYSFRFDVGLRPGEYGVTVAIGDTPVHPSFKDYLENATVLSVTTMKTAPPVFGLTLPSGRSAAMHPLPARASKSHHD